MTCMGSSVVYEPQPSLFLLEKYRVPVDPLLRAPMTRSVWFHPEPVRFVRQDSGRRGACIELFPAPCVVRPTGFDPLPDACFQPRAVSRLVKAPRR